MPLGAVLAPTKELVKWQMEFALACTEGEWRGNRQLLFMACITATICWYLRPCLRHFGRNVRDRVCTDCEVLRRIGAVRHRYCLSERGFLPATCAEHLPPSFDAWETLVAKLPQLNRDGLLRQAVEAMPELDVRELLCSGDGAVHRAYLVLSMLAHSYVHGPTVPWHLLDSNASMAFQPTSKPSERNGHESFVVPSQLARPWFAICCALKMPPVLTAGSTDMWNWRLRDPKGPFVPSNLELTASMTGTDTETNFHTVPCAMEAAAGQVIPKLFLADVLLSGGRDVQLAALLRELTDVLKQFKEFFSLVAKGVDRDIFYDVYRPLLKGFYPEGVVLCGLDAQSASAAAPFLKVEVADMRDDAIRVCIKGASAGQSTMFMLFDLFLGVEHRDLAAEFQEEMLGYMPEPHRKMVCDFREKWLFKGGLRERLMKAEGKDGSGASLVEAHEECICALRDLRNFHLATVQRYLRRTSTGTGASTWRQLLHCHIVNTQRASTCPFRPEVQRRAKSDEELCVPSKASRFGLMRLPSL